MWQKLSSKVRNGRQVAICRVTRFSWCAPTCNNNLRNRGLLRTLAVGLMGPHGVRVGCLKVLPCPVAGHRLVPLRFPPGRAASALLRDQRPGWCKKL